MDPEALYIQLGRLVETIPDLDDHPYPTTTHHWLGDAGALITEMGDMSELVQFKAAMNGLTYVSLRYQAAQEIVLILYRALAIAEMRAPVSAQGAFIAAGNSFDAFAVVGKVLGTATADILIVDPQLDEKALTDFAPLAREGVSIRLLADTNAHKPTLIPASKRWATQYGTARPLDVRLAFVQQLEAAVIAEKATREKRLAEARTRAEGWLEAARVKAARFTAP